MPKLRVHNLAMSLDGFVAGPDQSVENPLGVDGERLHGWMFETKFGRAMIGEPGGDIGVDNDFLEQGVDNIGATIMGRNMFGPIRGPWGDEDWRGWWGSNPPYHHHVFVLTHHPRPSIEMEGGTTFHFVDDPIEQVLEKAFDAAGGADVRLGGGASAVRQYLRAGLVDELHVPIVPLLLGAGERLFDDLAGITEMYERSELIGSSAVCHVRLVRIRR
jgi:dihydrofolate reductase